MATVAAPIASKRFEGLLLDFLAYLEFERGLSRNTLEAYRTDLLQFGRFLDAHHVSAVDASAADVSDFLTHLAGGNGKSASPATIHRKAACLRSFYRHLRREGIRDSDPTASLSAPRRGRKLPQVLSRGGGGQAAEPAPGHRARGASRPRAARAHVRLRPPGLG